MKEEKYNIEQGEEKAWRELREADPELVSRNSLAAYDSKAGTYTLTVLGEKYAIDPGGMAIVNLTNPARAPEYLLKLSIPVYLVQARDIPPSGELVKDLPGGGFFFRGSHALPLDAIAEKFGRDSGSFERAGRSTLGGTPAGMGDAAVAFNVFPRVSMALVLWLSDEEFPARATLLFDSNAGRHMALDVVWAVSLVACQRMLKY